MGTADFYFVWSQTRNGGSTHDAPKNASISAEGGTVDQTAPSPVPFLSPGRKAMSTAYPAGAKATPSR